MKPDAFTTWVLVCDASHARIFAIGGNEKAWTLVQTIEHPEGRLHDHDMVSDRQGRIQESASLGRRSAMEPDTHPKEVEAQRFAERLAERLDEGLGDERYSRLLLTAPPHFLGLLRARLSDRVQRRLTFSLDHDYTWVEAHQLPDRLGAYV